MLTHIKSNDNCELFNYLQSVTHTVSVYGFFVLSSFLLTYKLLNELDNSNYSKFWIIIKYLIRRFFRIYLVFFLVATCIKFGPKYLEGRLNDFEPTYNSWSDIVSLKHPGDNHLWSISPEFQYYLFIPIFCLIALYLNPIIMLFICVTFSVLNEVYNLFDLKPEDFEGEVTYFFKQTFSVFFYGSIAALLLFIMDKNEKLKRFVNEKKIQFLIHIMSIILLVYGLKFIDSDLVKQAPISGRIWSCFILLLVLSRNNSRIVEVLNNNFLRKCGLYSFGMYLLHPIFIKTTYDYFNFTLQIDNAVLIFIKSFIAGYFFYHLVETKCMELGSFVIRKIESKFFKLNKY